jgi:hypothetical protein
MVHLPPAARGRGEGRGGRAGAVWRVTGPGAADLDARRRRAAPVAPRRRAWRPGHLLRPSGLACCVLLLLRARLACAAVVHGHARQRLCVGRRAGGSARARARAGPVLLEPRLRRHRRRRGRRRRRQQCATAPRRAARATAPPAWAAARTPAHLVDVTAAARPRGFVARRARHLAAHGGWRALGALGVGWAGSAAGRRGGRASVW